MKRVPFTKPSIGKKEVTAVTKALLEGNIGGNGCYTRQAEERIAERLKARYVFLTTSATHALEMAMMCLGIGSGDEVICPSFTFVSTANAIVRQGGIPRFCDIEPGSLNIDIDQIEKCINRRTKAIVPVHYAGFSCDMDRLMKLARRHGLIVIEDAAQAIGATCRGRFLGTIGDIGVISFHVTKNITCGEGGVLLTNNSAIAQRADIIREKGTNRKAFLEGQVHKYTWLDVGSSFIPSDLLAALLLEQLKKIDRINTKRLRIFDTYYAQLKPLADEGMITLPDLPDFSKSNGHIFWFLVDNEKTRSVLVRELNQAGIQATFHYVPLHDSPFGKHRLGYRTGELPVTESVARRLVRLPLFDELADRDIETISKTVTHILRKKRS